MSEIKSVCKEVSLNGYRFGSPKLSEKYGMQSGYLFSPPVIMGYAGFFLMCLFPISVSVHSLLHIRAGGFFYV